MIYVKRARMQDLPAIQVLMNETGKMQVTEKHLNKHDVAIQARDENGALVGFIWCGLMANSTVGYLDLFAVARSHANQGVGHALAKAMLDEMLKRNVKEVFGIIKQDKFHDKSAMNALKMAMGSDMMPYTLVRTNIAHTAAELQGLGA